MSEADIAKVRERLEIEQIARELNRSLPEVAKVFAELDSELRRRASVTDYLSVLVARKVRNRFRSAR